MQVSGSYNIFPQHCIMLSLTHEQHAKEVNIELKDAAFRLSKQARLKLVKAIKQTIKDIEDEKKGVEKVATEVPERVDTSTQVTTTTSPTNPNSILPVPKTHQKTRDNTPMTTVPIV